MKTLNRNPVPQLRDVAPSRRENSAPARNTRVGKEARQSSVRARKILVPIDYSETSRRAFELACILAGGTAAGLTLVHVATPPYRSIGMAEGPPLPTGYRGAWESRLGLIRPLDPLVRVEYRIEEGEPVDGILRVAGEIGCDLIVMGTRRKVSLGQLLKRRVSGSVSRQAPCPVLTLTFPAVACGERTQTSAVRDASGYSFRWGQMLNGRTILHATDFSRASRYSFSVARDLARASGCPLLMAHVAPTHHLCRSYFRKELGEVLRRYTMSDPRVLLPGLLLPGDPVEQIVSTANQLDCSLIVMGAGARTGLSGLFRGGKSAQVQKSVRCPVLSVRLPADWA